MLTQPQKNLLGIMPTIIQKGLSPQQGTQLALFLKQLTKGAMGPSYNIFDPVSGTANLGIKLISLAESGKIKLPDILMGIGAIYLSSHIGLSPDVWYEGEKYLLSQLPSPTQATTQVSSTINPQKQNHPITTTDFGPHPSVQDDKNKKDLVVVPIKDCYDDTGKNSYCVKTDSKRGVGFCNDDDIDCIGEDYVLPSKDATGKWYYPPNALEKAQKDAADKAAIDAGRDAKGLNGHGYDSLCPSGHSKGYCGSYRQVYDNVWKDLHSSSPVATPNALTAEQPTPTITDKGNNDNKKVELDGYHCTNEGCGYYQDGICKTCGKSTSPIQVPSDSEIPFLPSSAPQPNTESLVSAEDIAERDASRDTQGLNGHSYDSSCPSGHSTGFCSDYKQIYDKHWKDLHSSVPVATSNALTTEKPTTTEQPIPTMSKSFQSEVQQKPSVPQKSEPSGQEIAGTPSVNNPPTTNPQATDNELNQQGLVGSNIPSTNLPDTSKQDTGTALSSGDPNSVVNNPQPLSTTPDQSVSGVQPGQGGGSAVVVPDKGQTTTTGQDQGMSGSGGSDDNSGSSGSTSGDSNTAPRDNSPPSDSSSTVDRHSSGDGDSKDSDKHRHSSNSGDSTSSGDDG